MAQKSEKYHIMEQSESYCKTQPFAPLRSGCASRSRCLFPIHTKGKGCPDFSEQP